MAGTERAARGSWLGRLGVPPPAGISAADSAPFGWAPLVVLFCVGMVDRIEYNIVAGVLPLIQRHFHVGDALAGSIPTATAIAGVLVAVPAGYLADRYRRTRIITVVVVSWSVITVASGGALSFAMFYLTRVVLGAADSINNPVAGSLLGDYYPPAARASAFGWQRLTVYAGTAVGTIAGGVLGAAAGWRSAFFVMAVPGLIVAWFCGRLREPPRGFVDRVAATGGEARVPVPASGGTGDADRPNAAGPGAWAQIRGVLKIRTAVCVGVGVGVLSLGLAGIFYWLPSLVYRTYGVGVGAASLTTGGISLVGVLAGTLLGMWLSRRWHQKVRGGRVLAGGGGMLIGSIVLGLSLMCGTFALFAVVLFTSVVIMSVAIPTLTAMIADVLGAGSRGTGFGVLQLVITGGTAGGPLIIGLSSEATGSLLTAMYALVIPMIIGGGVTLAARGSADRDAATVLTAARDDPSSGHPGR